ncbi:hypothetical protein [Brevundimonas sp. TWP2-3-4b1]|uniref:hypothetical protein n=1 Tax=Brevundimonas sp. TWP2-3-4b1 TaxID=2804580 RepID=UPI003CEAE7F5
MTIQAIKTTQDATTYKIKVRELAGNDGLLKGFGQIAGYLFGDRSLAAQIEQAAEVGDLPHFHLNGELCATKTALELYAYRLLGGAEPRDRKERRRRHGDRRTRGGGRANLPPPFRCGLPKGKILALTPEGKVVVVTIAAPRQSPSGNEAAA